MDVNGRGGRGYGRKIQTSPTFDKKMFLEEKESVVRRNPIEQVEATVLDVIDLLPKDMSPEDLLALNDLFKNDASLHHFCVGIESLYRSPKVASKTRNPSSTSPMKALQRKKSTDNILRGLRSETSTDVVPAVVVDVIVTEVKRPTTPSEKVGKEAIVQKPSSRCDKI